MSSNQQNFLFQCNWCGQVISPVEAGGPRLCPQCSGSLEVVYDYEELRKKFSGIPSIRNADGIWKYSPILPARSNIAISLGEGGTPYRQLKKIGSELGLGKLYVKDESRNPTCSFKDRKSASAITMALEDGYNKVVAATAGNAGSSVAAYAAKAGIESYIFAFQGISTPKLAKLLAYGANVFLTRASTGDVLEFVDKVCKEYGLQNCSAASRYNPYVKEGAKTAVFEMFEQTQGNLPDCIILPVGGGGNIAAYYKGLKELKQLGLIERYPRLVGVQGSGCEPVVEAFEKNLDPRNIPKVKNPKTIAHSILDDWAPDGDIAWVSIKETKGLAIGVPDEDIIEAMKSMSEKEAIYAEPSSAAPLAALKHLLADKKIDRSETVALIVTGFGLNQPDATIDSYSAPPTISLDLAGFGEYLKR